ncbi:MAG: ATP-dependent RNA helicase DbpA [Phycisphaerae bacterium]|nr:ATP-dependent RNA helicase DbpA [Phycisphaerae bacterium]
MNAIVQPAAYPSPEHDVMSHVRRTWGFDRLRPLQAEAIDAALAGRDALVVMPTGGGKSLCYQVPPLVSRRMSVVVSPLISLMKDQVDGLRACGYPAAALNSALSADERRETERQIASGQCRLLFVSPEKLLSDFFSGWLARFPVGHFAIDEAHCVSHWGHDFRPEYRQLRMIRDRFPSAAIHAFTATATRRVRDDVVAQLGLRDPCMLVGCFDRPNLAYRVIPRTRAVEQADAILRRHAKQASIVYCMTRKETDATAAELRGLGHRVAAYHAGMSAGDRRRVQDRFASEALDVVVATVAFGMGIDRSDVRCVIHASMPKSIEHYQQETGRAGRDGLEAECVLLYSAADVFRWEGLMTRSAVEAGAPDSVIQHHVALLRHMRDYCAPGRCRHRQLSEYFDQEYPRGNCGACDTCLAEHEEVGGATVLAQKILSCVCRVGERFGVRYVVDVLRGANTEAIRRNGHDRLSTYALLKGEDPRELTQVTYQLLDQGMLSRVGDDKPVVRLNEASWRVLRGQQEVRLWRSSSNVTLASQDAGDAWAGVDPGLFEALRDWRRETAVRRAVPAFVIFGDATLRELARRRPSSTASLLQISGIGERKQGEFGEELLRVIDALCREHGLTRDVPPENPAGGPRPRRTGPLPEVAARLFRKGWSVARVAEEMCRAESTVWGYLAEFAAREDAPLDPWIQAKTVARIEHEADRLGDQRLKPIHEALGGDVSYNEIRVVLRRRDKGAHEPRREERPGC